MHPQVQGNTLEETQHSAFKVVALDADGRRDGRRGVPCAEHLTHHGVVAVGSAPRLRLEDSFTINQICPLNAFSDVRPCGPGVGL